MLATQKYALGETMKKILLITLLFLSACAPQLAHPLMVYAATTEQITDTIVATANRTKPEGGYSNWTVTGTGETSVSLRSDPDFWGKLSNNSTLTMIWSVSNRFGGVAVAVDSRGFSDPRKTEQVFFDALDSEFQHLQTTP
jgi:hypothetical protein